MRPVSAAPILERRSSLRALRHRDFALFWTAAAISNGGSWMQAVAVPALLFQLTDSATWLGISSLATLLPAVVLTPYAGALADRASRRRILLITQTAQMATALALFALYAGDALTPGLIVALGLATGVATGFQASVWQSFVPLLVPPDDLLEAVKLNSMQFTLARALGPAFAGVVVATTGFGAAFLINAVTYLLVIGALVVARPRPNAVADAGVPVRQIVLDGARYVIAHRPLRLAVVLAFVTACCGQSLQYVAPAVADRIFGRPSTDNAGLLVALGVGALVSSWFSVIVGDRLRRSQRVVLSLLLFTVSAGLLPLTSAYAVGLGAYFIGGLAHLQLAIALNTLVQGSVPDEWRGRAMSFYVLGVIAGIPAGSIVLGRLADVIGTRPTLAIDAVVLASVAALLTITGGLRALDVSTPEQLATHGR